MGVRRVLFRHEVRTSRREYVVLDRDRTEMTVWSDVCDCGAETRRVEIRRPRKTKRKRRNSWEAPLLGAAIALILLVFLHLLYKIVK